MATADFPGPPQNARADRRRTRKACDQCRRRKKKCDGLMPCTLCQELRYACLYSATDIPTSSKNSQERQSLDDHTASLTLVEPTKLRSVEQSSSLAFPLLLAQAQGGSDVLPRLHSYAYNLGIKSETFFDPKRSVPLLIGSSAVRQYATVFFDVVNSVFQTLDPETFDNKISRYWDHAEDCDPLFEVIVAYTVLLGSYFSWPSDLPNSQQLADYASQTLSNSCFQAPSLVQMDHIVAWVLRTIYSRLTTRPNVCWMASSISMHLAESLGLHKEWGSLQQTKSQDPLQDSIVEYRRPLFWSAWVLNRMISLDYGRQPVQLEGLNIKLPITSRGQTLSSLAQTYLGTPLTLSDTSDEALEQFEAAMRYLLEENATNDFIAISKGELAASLFRKLLPRCRNFPDSTASLYVEVEDRALTAAWNCFRNGRLWWHIVGVPFQYLCSSIAIGSSQSLQALPRISDLLQAASQKLNSHLLNEAYGTAEELIKLATKKREREMQQLLETLSTKYRSFESYGSFIETTTPGEFENLWGNESA